MNTRRHWRLHAGLPTVFVLHVLRHNQVSLHDGSWTEWEPIRTCPCKRVRQERTPS